MAACKECLHYEACVLNEAYWVKHNADQACHAFKDKSKCVEVVRCKDCKYWRSYDGMIEGNVCYATFDHHGRERITTSDDFCSCGAKMDGD